MDLSNENVIHIKKGNVEYLQFRRLLEYSKDISHAYSLGINTDFRTAKVDKTPLDEKKYKKALRCYQNLCTENSMDFKNLVKTNQEHTDNVKIVDKKINKNNPDFNLECYNETDGLITDKKNLILATTNADCILMLFYDPVKKVIANVHSGWKGTLQGISIKCVQKMIDEKGCNPSDIICAICPSIRKCHFEVQRDVYEMFANEFSDLQEIDSIITKQENNEKWNIDTVLINKIILSNAGLKKENIIDSGICSVCNKEIVHSFRAEGQNYGLATALISLLN